MKLWYIHIVVYKTLLVENESTVTTYTNLDISHKQCQMKEARHKRIEHILYESINIKFKNKLKWPMALEIKIVIPMSKARVKRDEKASGML